MTNRLPDPQIIYIAGFPRSGSTILENVMARAPDVCSVGELRSIWKQGLIDRGLCSCGAPVAECEFWTSVFEVAFNETPPDPEAVHDAQWRYLRARPTRLLQLTRHPPVDPPAGLRAYVDLLVSLYRAAATVSGSKVVVDSSKTPVEPLALMTMTDLDVRVVHLVRDPRAVAYSVSRTKAAPDRPVTGVMTTMHPLSCALRWLFANEIIAQQLRRVAGDRYMLCRYEDFAADPDATGERIRGFAGMPADGLARTGPEDDGAVETHSPGGNPVRLARGRRLSIEPDRRWRHGMSVSDRLWATAPALPLLRRFGYPLWV